MKILKIKIRKFRNKPFYNYYDRYLYNAPTYIVKLTLREYELLMKSIEEKNNEKN